MKYFVGNYYRYIDIYHFGIWLQYIPVYMRIDQGSYILHRLGILDDK